MFEKRQTKRTTSSMQLSSAHIYSIRGHPIGHALASQRRQNASHRAHRRRQARARGTRRMRAYTRSRLVHIERELERYGEHFGEARGVVRPILCQR